MAKRRAAKRSEAESYHAALESESYAAPESGEREVSELAGQNTLELVAAYRAPTPSFHTKPTGTETVLDAIAGTLPESSVALETVIDVDDRTRIAATSNYPWRAICALRIRSKSGRNYVGTGWLIGPRTVASAGHCVYMHNDGGWAASIQVIPGLDGAQAPFGRHESRRFRAVDGWVRHRASGSDYAAIQLDSAIGDEVGWFSFGALSETQIRSVNANLAGYPADRDSAARLYYHARRVADATESKLHYDIDTFGGQSGSPIWLNLPDGRVAIGIHTTGGQRANSGTRINADVFANLRRWKRE